MAWRLPTASLASMPNQWGLDSAGDGRAPGGTQAGGLPLCPVGSENRVLRVIALHDRESVQNAFIDRGFPEANTLDIELADRVSSSSDTVSDNLIVDFDELGKPLAVTLEHHAQIGDTSTIETLLPITPALQPA